MKKLLLVGALFCGAAQAAFWDGNELLMRLNSDDPNRRSLALGYIMGVHDAMENYNHCPPNNATAGQMRDIVRNYVTNTPAERHFTAETLVLIALKTAFPCAKGGRQL